MTGVGAYLAERRTALGLSLETLAADTRIAHRVLQALEGDRLEGLPSAVYVRGFIRACCARLGDDPQEALRRYEAQRAEAGLPEAGPLPAVEAVLRVPPEESAGSGRSRRLIAAAVGLAVVGGVAYRLGLFDGLLRPRGPGATAGVPGAPAEGARRPAGVTVARGPIPAEAAVPVARVSGASPAGFAPAPAEAPSGDGTGTARVLVLRAEETTWVRVVSESGRASEALLTPGAVKEWRSDGRFVVTVGNAGGVHLELDGTPLPALGARGQVVRDVVLPRPVKTEAAQ